MEKNTGKLFTPVHGTPMDYLRWRGDLTFRQDGFNEVDNLVLCIISYINFRRITAVHTTEPAAAPTLAQVAPLLTEEDDQLGLSELSYLPLVQLAAKTPRFRDVRLFAYTHEYDEAQAKQFDALSFLLPDGTLFVAFMGTDTSLAGWKEDFNMSFLSAVPAQARAAAYAADMAALCPDMPLRIGGHSKGGNLAAWAAIHLPADLQEHCLLSAYNNDGPGFARDMLETPEYLRVADKLHTYIPESSIVGVLLVHAEDYDVIDSTSHAAMQHEALSWQVMGNRFVHLGQRSQLGQMSDDVLREWLDSVSQEDREAFCDALYSILSMGGRAKTFEDLRKGGFSGWAALWKEYAGADERKKQILTEVFGRLAIDVKDELMKAAGQGLRSAGHGIRTVGQNLMGRHEPDKTQTK